MERMQCNACSACRAVSDGERAMDAMSGGWTCWLFDGGWVVSPRLTRFIGSIETRSIVAFRQDCGWLGGVA